MLGLYKPYQSGAGVLAGLLLARVRSSSTQVHLLTLQASITGSEARRLAFGGNSTNQGHALRLTEPQQAKWASACLLLEMACVVGLRGGCPDRLRLLTRLLVITSTSHGDRWCVICFCCCADVFDLSSNCPERKQCFPWQAKQVQAA